MYLTLLPRPFGELAAATYEDHDAAVLDTAAVVEDNRLRKNCSLATPGKAAPTPRAGEKASTLGMRFILSKTLPMMAAYSW